MNLDAMDLDELREFSNDETNDASLRHYAGLKAVAMKWRLEEDTPNALRLERVADEYYQKLPDELKW